MRYAYVFVCIMLTFAYIYGNSIPYCNASTYLDTHPSFTKVTLLNQTYYVLTSENLTHPYCSTDFNLFSGISYLTLGAYYGFSAYMSQPMVLTDSNPIYTSQQNINYTFRKNKALWPTSGTNVTVIEAGAPSNVGVDISYSNSSGVIRTASDGSAGLYVIAHTNTTGDYLCWCSSRMGGCPSTYGNCTLIADDTNYNISIRVVAAQGYTISARVITKNEFMNATKAPRVNCTAARWQCDPTRQHIDLSVPYNRTFGPITFSSPFIYYRALYTSNTTYAASPLNLTRFLNSSANFSTFYARIGDLSSMTFIYTNETQARLNNPYEAYVVTSTGYMVKPDYTLHLTPNESVLFYKPYNPITFKTILYGGTAAVVRDAYGVCYFVPPYTPSNYSLTYTLTGYQIDCESTATSTRTIPVLPKRVSCYKSGTNYSMNLEYDQSVLFERYITYTNNTVVYRQSTALTYYENVSNLVNISKIELKVNNYTRCYWTNETKVIGLPDLPNDADTNKLVGYPLLLFTTALSVVNPFVFIFAIAVNDMFELVDITGILMLAIAIGLFSFISAWEGEKTLKSLIVLFLITAVAIVQMAVYSPIFSSDSNLLTTRIDQLADTFNAITSSSDIVVIITMAVPMFLINLFMLLLELPALMVGIIITALTSLVPALAGPLSAFGAAITVGAYAWLILKAYELGRNTFRGV